MSGDVLFVGSRRDDTAGADAGSAYVFEFSGVGANYCGANTNSSGLPGAICATGSTLVADNDLTLVAANLPTNQFGYFLNSQTQRFVPFAGGSQGNLCIGSPLIRFSANVLNSGVDGTMAFALDLTQLPQGVMVLAGQTWNFQCWFRDMGSSSNASGGLALTLR